MVDSLTEQWVRTAADRRAVEEGCRFDPARAERVRKFFRTLLRHSKGQWAGKPFEPMEWQWQDILAPVFGWVRPDGSRRFRRVYIELPKKNGKSTLASGVGLYLLVADGEQGAEVYSAAADREQASIVHGEAVRMVQASPALSARLEINKTTRNIAFAATNSWYRALSAEAETKEGLNAHGIIIDELHAWKGRALWDTLRYAGRARRQPLLFVITTAGDDMLSVCREQHDYARAILNGSVEDTRVFAYIRAARQRSEGDEADDDWTDPETWRRANPSLGLTIDEKEFAADVAEAEKSPTTQSSFKRYSLNTWATSTNPWLRSQDWSACRRPFAAADMAGRPCYGGLDLASVSDLCAFALAFPWDTDLYRLLCWFWLPEDTVADKDSPEQYRVWARAGHLRVTPGNVTDYAFIKRDLLQLARDYDLREYAYDPWNAEQLTQSLEEEGGIKRVAFPQTVNHYAEPTREFERLVIAGKMHHDGNPVLAWMAGHVTCRTDPSGNKRPVKPAQGDRRKVDGITASVMALARALKHEGGASVYDSRGLESI